MGDDHALRLASGPTREDRVGWASGLKVLHVSRERPTVAAGVLHAVSASRRCFIEQAFYSHRARIKTRILCGSDHNVGLDLFDNVAVAFERSGRVKNDVGSTSRENPKNTGNQFHREVDADRNYHAGLDFESICNTVGEELETGVADEWLVLELNGSIKWVEEDLMLEEIGDSTWRLWRTHFHHPVWHGASFLHHETLYEENK